VSVGSAPEQRFIASQRLRISYWDWGNETAPLLLFVHGGSDHARSWDGIVDGVRDEYHVAAIDMRGHGDSEWAPGSQYGLPDMALDVVRLIEHLGAPAYVVGHSMGAATSLLAAGTYPELFTGIVALEGTHSMNPPAFAEEGMGPAWMRNYADQVRGFEGTQAVVYPTREAVAERLQRQSPNRDPELIAHLAQWGTRDVPGGFIWKYDLWQRARAGLEVRSEELPRFWATIDCPVLLVNASQGSPRAVQRPDAETLFKDARTVVVDPSSHAIQHDQPERTIHEIRSFLAGLSPASQPIS
jgi:pimeloyl-ACP methyl ester carboxylesterase